MRSLGIHEIDTTDAEIVDEQGKDIMVVKNAQNASGKKIIITTFINRDTNRVKGILTTDVKGKPLVTSEIKSYNGMFPKTIVYNWYEEDRVMQIDIENPNAGRRANPELWVIPDIYPQIDMGVD